MADDLGHTRTDLDAAARHAREEAEQSDRRAELWPAVRKVAEQRARWFAFVAVVASVVISLLATYVALDAAGRVSAAETAAAVQDQQTKAALSSLNDANSVLQARGQARVEPPNLDPSEVQAAAIKARVIAALPPNPTAQQVASILAPAMAANVNGPPVEEFSRQLADYFARNPVPPGKPGEAGKPGPAPTAAQIQAAVLAESEAFRGPQGVAGAQGLPGESIVGPAGPEGQPGKDGAPGRPGRSVTGQRFVSTSDGCVSEVTFDDGTSQSSPAGPAACPIGSSSGSSSSGPSTPTN